MRSSLFFFLLAFSFSWLLCASAQDSWTFTKLKGKGSLLGKERFLHHYLIEPGDIFDEAKHKHSLVKICDALKHEGYLAAEVSDVLVYDKKSNTVAATLTLVPGSCFTIGRVLIELAGSYETHLRDELQKLVEQTLFNAYAVKETIDKEAERIRMYLLGKGYKGIRLSLTTHKDTKKAKITITYTIKLSKGKQIVFDGNQFFSDEKLLAEVLALESQGISVPLALMAEDIAELYNKKGFFNVTVTWQETDNERSFHIEEGVRSRFVPPGRGPRSAQTGLMAVMYKVFDRVHDTSEINKIDQQVDTLLKAMVNDLYAQGVYDEEPVKEILNKVVSDLRDLGYWDATIYEEKAAFDTDTAPKYSYGHLKVVLGERRMIKDLEIVGYPELSKGEPFRSWTKLTDLKAVSPQVVDEQKKSLQDHFKRQGYLYVTVQYAFKTADQGPLLVWTIDTQNGPVRFGTTKVVGLQRMKPETVLRERTYKEGDIWQGAKIDETVQRLKGLSMFESISVVPEDSGQQVQPLIIKCIEDDPFEIRTRLGFQFVSKSFTHLSWTTYKIGGSFVWKNPAGIADRLSLDADLTRYTRNLAATYELPWVGSWPLRTAFRVYSDRYDQPFISSSHHRLYKEAHDGLSVTFHHYHAWWSGYFKAGFELNELFGISRNLAKVIQFEPALVDERTPYFYVEPTVTFEHFDNKNDPCKGFNTTFALKAMVPTTVKDGWFIRALFEQSFFYPLYRNVIGAFRWRFGHIFNAKFSTILPTERFYLGGSNSLRGYETNMVPPLNDLICDNECLLVPVGGKSMANVNLEVRFPLYRWLSGVLFTDMGVLAQDRFADIAANKWLGASGFGLRCATPVGPIRFDIGWKWQKRDPKDTSFAWFLTLGHAF